ncbi:hypothetical protein XM38_001910 [Halomicronema hongdechloris C2206]|uniref:Uncharacterized protein n=1 Tax=Halomicronema hongdechloris C2206 TaxID=1641165 RepID=A0A1Z3HG33_9CYAN|nr:hypothetical protein [Halomicronema hongdechloris]ASC69264.1 hypothetical protein XM38_001910 [Halomicronema hongdechloris C2206]
MARHRPPMGHAYGWMIGLVLMSLGYGVGGWLLAAFQVPGIVWWVTQACTVHLAISGPSAILLSNLWVIGLMLVCAAEQPWPALWPARIPTHHAQTWATILIGLWGVAIALILLLAWFSHWLDTKGYSCRHRVIWLLPLCWGALGIGAWIYRVGLGS